MAQTNQSIRKVLGEAGFIEQADRDIHVRDRKVSIWKRFNETLLLTEFGNDASPYVQREDGTPVNPDLLGVRNPNIQNDGSPDE